MMLLPEDSVDNWAKIVSNVGVPVAILMFIGWCVMRLLPVVVEWFTQSTKTAATVAEAVPKITEAVRDISEDHRNGQESILALLKEVREEVRKK